MQNTLKNNYQHTVRNLTLATALFASFALHASDLRDVKESQLTTEQKAEIFSKMSNNEIELIDNYEGLVNYTAVINETKAPDLSYNEKLKIISSQQNK